jgi:dienelactone hydrolase
MAAAMSRGIRVWAMTLLLGASGGAGCQPGAPEPSSRAPEARGLALVDGLLGRAPDWVRDALPEHVLTAGSYGARPAASVVIGDGALVARGRLGSVAGAALDVVAYSSSGLVVAGLLCYPDDGLPHSAVVHVHGGLGGVFDGSDPGILQSCFEWAAVYGRTAFVPSLRGQDGGEGRLELCKGEADDVAAGVTMLRSLEVTDPARVALVGGSMGACTVLQASSRIAGLRAVVAYAPPTDWRALVAYHRTSWSPAVETRCDGTTFDWSIGGPGFADGIDSIICGHPGCPDADYDVRSPIPGSVRQSAPTLVTVAGADNIVPPVQQLLWPAERQASGHPVDVYVTGPCDPYGTPPPAMDVVIYVPSALHRLGVNPVSSGLLFLMQELDRPIPALP